MSPRGGRTQPCGRDDARVRLEHARAFVYAARLIETEEDDPAMANVAASLAVLAGIAAADAATCAALGRRSRGRDHRQAEAVLAEIMPDGAEAGKHLARLLDLKDSVQYGMIHVSRAEITAALRRADRLIAFAELQLHR